MAASEKTEMTIQKKRISFTPRIHNGRNATTSADGLQKQKAATDQLPGNFLASAVIARFQVGVRADAKGADPLNVFKLHGRSAAQRKKSSAAESAKRSPAGVS